jgi:hypothetical protein
MKKMCFFSVANGEYQKFIPWFLFSIHEAYPESNQIIYVDGKIQNNVKKALNLLNGNFIVRENAFDKYGKMDKNRIKYMRWLIHDPLFDQFDCLSIGDVDFIICKEDPTYMEQHLKHCELIGLPYSNFVRPLHVGPPRLSGINVVKPKEWFSAMDKVMDKYRVLLQQNNIQFPNPMGLNEQLLLKMVKESSLGDPPDDLFDTYWNSLKSSNHHGVHINLAMGGPNSYRKTINYELNRDELRRICTTYIFNRLKDMFPRIGKAIEQASQC